MKKKIITFASTLVLITGLAACGTKAATNQTPLNPTKVAEVTESTQTPVPTSTPTPEPTLELTPVPTSTLTPEPTLELTPVPTSTPTPEPTLEPTPEATQKSENDHAEYHGGVDEDATSFIEKVRAFVEGKSFEGTWINQDDSEGHMTVTFKDGIITAVKGNWKTQEDYNIYITFAGVRENYYTGEVYYAICGGMGDVIAIEIRENSDALYIPMTDDYIPFYPVNE